MTPTRIILAFGPLLALLGGLQPARAQNCSDSATMAAMGECENRALGAVDAALNEAYSRIVGRLKPEPPARAALLEAQRSWLRFRDAECAFATIGSQGGSIRPVLVVQCRTRLTAQRLEQLRAYLRCQEGDLDCPVPPAP